MNTNKIIPPRFSGFFGPLLIPPTDAELEHYRQNLPATQGCAGSFSLHGNFYIVTTRTDCEKVQALAEQNLNPNQAIRDEAEEKVDDLLNRRGVQSVHPAHPTAKH